MTRAVWGKEVFRSRWGHPLAGQGDRLGVLGQDLGIVTGAPEGGQQDQGQEKDQGGELKVGQPGLEGGGSVVHGVVVLQ